MSVSSEAEKRPAEDGSGAGEGKSALREGSKVNSKLSKGTGGWSKGLEDEEDMAVIDGGGRRASVG